MKNPLFDPNRTRCSVLRTKRPTCLSKCLLAILGATALSFHAFGADTDVGLKFNGQGGEDTQAGIITVNITADTVTLTGTAGARTVALNPPKRDAFPSYIGGSFTINFEALGTIADNFDPADFTGGLADGVFSGNTEWAVNSDINANVNTIIGQGLVFTFDFTNLTGANGVNLSAIRMNNDGDGARVRYLQNGTTVSTAVYNGGGAVGSNVTQFVTQALETGDKISFHTGDTGNPSGNGQVRLTELFFDFIPTTILAPDLTASVGTSETVVLDWNDDLSGLATSYEVYRSTTSGSYGAPIATLTGGTFASEFTDTGLTNGTKYFYQVVATDGVSPATSNEFEATPYATVEGSSVYAHYDASNAANVTVAGFKVTDLADLSGNGYGAEDGNGTQFGDVLYPSTSLSPTGLAGLDMGSTRNTLRTLLPNEQPDLLDFTSAANALPYSGFAFFAVVKVDSILAGTNSILGNNDNVSNGSLMLRLDGPGNSPRLFIGNQDSGGLGNGSTSTTIANAGASIVAGDTVVIAGNYDKATGALEFWNSNAGTSVTGTVPAADFSNTSQNASALFIGGTNNATQFMDGMFGELKLFQGKLTPSEFAAEQEALEVKWIGTRTPAGLVATEEPGAVALDWDDQLADSYTVYRSLTEFGGYSAIAGPLTSSDFLDSSLINGTTYYYYVTATSGADVSDPSATVSATPFTPIPGNALYAHYDATDAGSVTVVNGNEVSIWADQTANLFDATAAGAGAPILYPSVLVTSSGLAGLDTRATTDSKLLVFDSTQQKDWLDFSSATNGAKEYSGFAVFAVVRPIAIGGGTNDIVFSNHGNATTTENSFALRYFEGRPQVVAGAQLISRDPVVAPGETVVLAVNYNSETGNIELWDSESGDSVTTAISATNFASTQQMFIAGTENGGAGMNGVFGELKIYRGTLTPAEFAAEQAALTAKWITGSPGFSSWINQPFAGGATVPRVKQGPNQDFDKDGISNLLEYAIAGEDPTVSNPTIGTFTASSLSFTKAAGTSGLTYAIQESTDLGETDDWSEVTGDSYVNDSGTISYAFSPGTPEKNFLRLRVISN
ncbi:hypothetical protein HZ994_06675 [Akkermansiaceae bacterium]|nr:hypothetical protein HZ994_06675 [Akkermansiaceae bacterium]